MRIYTLKNNNSGQTVKALYCNQINSCGSYTEYTIERYVDINNGQVHTDRTYSIVSTYDMFLTPEELVIVTGNIELAKSCKSIKKSVFA